MLEGPIVSTLEGVGLPLGFQCFLVLLDSFLMYLLACKCRRNTSCFPMCFGGSFDLSFASIFFRLRSKDMSLKRLAFRNSSPGYIPHSEEAPPSNSIVDGLADGLVMCRMATHKDHRPSHTGCEDVADQLNRTLQSDDNRD
jgi:hypothetical protein